LCLGLSHHPPVELRSSRNLYPWARAGTRG
jgi:hypothetical protein